VVCVRDRVSIDCYRTATHDDVLIANAPDHTLDGYQFGPNTRADKKESP
jgi:hypothetical protein